MTNFKLTRTTQRRSVKVSSHLIGRLFVAAASLVAVAGVQAQNATPYSNNGGSMYGMGQSYMGVNVGQSDFSRVNNGNGLFPTDRNTTDYSIYAGSYFNNSRLGFELGYTDFVSVNRAGS